MSKFYVAGKCEEREKIRELMQTLISLGNEITVDWTVHERSDTGYPAAYAQEDIEGVRRADIYIGYFMNKNDYKGALVELGAALGLGKRVFIVGHAIDSCIFVGHPLVTQVDSKEEFLSLL